MTDTENLVRLLSDSEFERIEVDLGVPNIFSILSVGRNELAHSNMLAWLLNPKGSHGIRELFLRRFLRDVVANEGSGLSVVDIETLEYGNLEIRREWGDSMHGRLDLLIVHEEFIVGIENKVDSIDSEGQIGRYTSMLISEFKGKAKNIYLIYLTPGGASPQKVFEPDAGIMYINYSYMSIMEHLEGLLRAHEILNPKSLAYMKDYLHILRRDIVQDDPLNREAAKLYRVHKEAFDFIIRNIPDVVNLLGSRLNQLVEENSEWQLCNKLYKGYTRFLPKILYQIIPQSEQGYQQEVFYFELYYYASQELPKKLTLQVVLSPKCDINTRKALLQALSAHPEFKDARGEQWKTYLRRNFTLKSAGDLGLNPDDVTQYADQLWNEMKIADWVNRIMDKFDLEKLKLALQLDDRS